MAAGIMHYEPRKFLTALALGILGGATARVYFKWYCLRSVARWMTVLVARFAGRSGEHFGNLQAAGTPRMITKNVKFR